MTTAQHLRDQIEYAPKDSGKIAEGLLGWWTADGYYVCSSCAGRIMGRGCKLPGGSEPVWSDRDEPVGVCCCCE